MQIYIPDWSIDMVYFLVYRCETYSLKTVQTNEIAKWMCVAGLRVYRFVRNETVFVDKIWWSAAMKWIAQSIIQYSLQILSKWNWQVCGMWNNKFHYTSQKLPDKSVTEDMTPRDTWPLSYRRDAINTRKSQVKCIKHGITIYLPQEILIVRKIIWKNKVLIYLYMHTRDKSFLSTIATYGISTMFYKLDHGTGVKCLSICNNIYESYEYHADACMITCCQVI